jgi:hypothetical protein
VKFALGLSGAALVGGIIGLGIAWGYEKLFGNPYYR